MGKAARRNPAGRPGPKRRIGIGSEPKATDNNLPEFVMKNIEHILRNTAPRALALGAILLACTTASGNTVTAIAQLYTWQFHSVTGSPASGQITSTDPNYPFGAVLPTAPAATSSSFSITDLALNIDL